MPRRRNPYSWCCGPILVLTMCIMWLFGAKFHMQDTLSMERELLSRVSEATTISRFYGPGLWWGWLITLGMTHSRTFLCWLNAEELAPEWDYDLIGASAYIVAAAIDLMHKARDISQLGDKASESILLPALLCAERVVAVGMGTSLFSITTAIYRGSSVVRTVGMAIIPLIFALVASGFAASAHQAIEQTAPLLWCSLHNGSKLEQYDVASSTLVDFPATTFLAVSSLPRLWMVRGYWEAAAGGIPVIALSFIARKFVQRPLLAHALGAGTAAAAAVMMLFALVPLFGAPQVVVGAVWWFVARVVLWWPVYVLAWFPRMGYFPLTGISVLEMDQIAALLGIASAAAIRRLQSCGTGRLAPPSGSGLSNKLSPLLPVSSRSGSPVAERQADVNETQGHGGIHEVGTEGVDSPVLV
ncbi:hypothetical protein DFH08DRAFT_870736 [Mycena albidolilacea]|uniref:Uncharacterized protein n=1 Tax=Mycena albidolilacea TaxID=1033008 RepID=A0AAD6ZYZ1_9AGAR|nr:hypothetical protein DFH08DRAFT_870736 [Mycena albidolilacea]